MQAQGYTRAAAITPSDANNIAPGFIVKAIYVGGAGDLTVVTPFGDTITFKAVNVGWWYPLQVNKVKATGTTATLLLALGD